MNGIIRNGKAVVAKNRLGVVASRVANMGGGCCGVAVEESEIEGDTHRPAYALRPWRLRPGLSPPAASMRSPPSSPSPSQLILPRWPTCDPLSP